MNKEIENKRQAAPTLDGKANETTTNVDTNNRNGKPTTAKPKAAKRKAARKAKKAKHNSTELITVKQGGKSVGFVFWEGCNLADFTAKNMPTVGLLDRDAAQAVLNKVCNAYMLTSGRFESVKIGKVSASYDKLSQSYVPNVAMRGRLRRETTKAERSEAFAKDESRFLQSIAERRLAL